MPIIVWGIGGIAALAGLAWAADEAGDAAEKTAKLVKWSAVAGGVYVTWRAAKTGGLIK